MKILVPDTIKLDLSQLSAAGENVVVYAVDEPIPAEHRDAEVLVAWRNTRENLADAAKELRALKLVQTLAAGPDSVLAAGFAENVAITSGRSLHDGPVAEHALAIRLALLSQVGVCPNRTGYSARRNTSLSADIFAPVLQGRGVQEPRFCREAQKAKGSRPESRTGSVPGPDFLKGARLTSRWRR